MPHRRRPRRRRPRVAARRRICGLPLRSPCLHCWNTGCSCPHAARSGDTDGGVKGRRGRRRERAGAARLGAPGVRGVRPAIQRSTSTIAAAATDQPPSELLSSAGGGEEAGRWLLPPRIRREQGAGSREEGRRAHLDRLAALDVCRVGRPPPRRADGPASSAGALTGRSREAGSSSPRGAPAPPPPQGPKRARRPSRGGAARPAAPARGGAARRRGREARGWPEERARERGCCS